MLDDVRKKMILDIWNKALAKTGALSALFAMLVFGILLLLLSDFKVSLSASIIAFSTSGFLEVFHLNRKADIYSRRQPIYDKDSLFWKFMSHEKKIFQPKMFEEFLYEEMNFKTFGFVDVPGPITITGPFCPRCKGNMLEGVSVKFPGNVRIVFNCMCGFSHKSKKTVSEIIYEISEFKSLPKNDREDVSKHKYLAP